MDLFSSRERIPVDGHIWSKSPNMIGIQGHLIFLGFYIYIYIPYIYIYPLYINIIHLSIYLYVTPMYPKYIQYITDFCWPIAEQALVQKMYKTKKISAPVDEQYRLTLINID